jgi:hypothetical protein
MADKPGTTDRPAPSSGDRQPVDPASRSNRPDLGRPDPPGAGTKYETWKEGSPAKPEQKPKQNAEPKQGGGKEEGKPEGHQDGKGEAKAGSKPEAKPESKGHGQTPNEWTGPRTPGGKPAPSKPTGDYHVPTQRIVRWRGEPAPREGSKSGGTSKADQARAQRAGERDGPPGHEWDAGHEKPASRTRPGERPYLRPEGRSENRAGGSGIAAENKARRQDSSHKDPASPNYTRDSRARSPEPKPATPEPKGKSPEPKPATPEPKPKTPEPRPPGGGKPPGAGGALEGLAHKLGPLGAIGDVQMIRDIATELEWRDNLSDPKWGNERTDMFGQTWYRSEIDKGTWTTKPMPSA